MVKNEYTKLEKILTFRPRKNLRQLKIKFEVKEAEKKIKEGLKNGKFILIRTFNNGYSVKISKLKKVTNVKPYFRQKIYHKNKIKEVELFYDYENTDIFNLNKILKLPNVDIKINNRISRKILNKYKIFIQNGVIFRRSSPEKTLYIEYMKEEKMSDIKVNLSELIKEIKILNEESDVNQTLKDYGVKKYEELKNSIQNFEKNIFNNENITYGDLLAKQNSINSDISKKIVGDFNIPDNLFYIIIIFRILQKRNPFHSLDFLFYSSRYGFKINNKINKFIFLIVNYHFLNEFDLYFENFDSYKMYYDSTVFIRLDGMKDFINKYVYT